MSTAVKNLLREAEQLSDKDLIKLESELARRREARADAALAPLRQIAKQRGITQAQIDRACHEVRYGSKARKR